MARRTRTPQTRAPQAAACFAVTVPGVEALAAAELEEKLCADIRRHDDGLVFFRLQNLDRQLLSLRLIEDVFLLAWGSDALTYRATDLEKIRQWTAREPDWPRLLALHAAIRPRPRGRPSFHLVTQMRGEHGYRRLDAGKAFRAGLRSHLPATWIEKQEDAWFEAWLTIQGRRAVCGVRLSDKTMRHRVYKSEHMPASLRPVVAAAMIRLAGAPVGEWLVDPMCGAGTILAEQLALDRRARVLGGDAEINALRASAVNLKHFRDEPLLVKWDATELPLANRSLNFLATNPPFGRQIGEKRQIVPFYHELVDEFDRVLAGGGKAVVLVGEDRAFQLAAGKKGWRQEARVRLMLLGQPCFILVWRKG